MATTFLEMTRSLRLFVPQVPITVAQQFVRDRYRRALERRPWSALRAENEFILDVEKSAGTVAVTRSSASVVGTSTSWASTDVGRQFKAGSGAPIYTILTVPTATSLTLDRVYGGETASAATYRIFDGYLTPPSDFMRFIVVFDPKRGYRIRHWVTLDQLQIMDPNRTFHGNPWILVDRRFSSTGRPMYEAWPYNTPLTNLPYYYVKRGADLADDADEPVWPIRSDAIVAGAKADLCRWPGLPNQPNPMFGRMDVWKSFEAEYDDTLNELERQDEDVYMTWVAGADVYGMPFAPISANYIQSHLV